MEKEITEQQARELAMLGESTTGYRIVKRSLKDRLVDALLQNTAFCAHMGFELLVNFASDNKSAKIFSSKDRNEYQINFELDSNGEPRITKITPIGRLEPNQEVIHVYEQMMADLPITEKNITEVKTLNEQDDKEAAQKWDREKLIQQRAAGLITNDQYFEKRDRLLLDQHKDRTAGKKLLFEAGEDNATKRKKIWEAQRLGEITIDQAA